MSIILLLAVVAASGPEAAAVARMQGAYQRGDLCADFEQTYIEKLRGKKRVESGRLFAKRDGRVRWSYERPLAKDFVCDGKRAWFYEPEAAQVTELVRFDESPLWAVIRMLFGQAEISEIFAIQACGEECPAAIAGTTRVLLKPLEPLAALEHVVLMLAAKEALLQKALVYDTLGNRTEYVFSRVVIGCAVDDGKFAFEVPEGVSVIRQSGEALR